MVPRGNVVFERAAEHLVVGAGGAGEPPLERLERARRRERRPGRRVAGRRSAGEARECGDVARGGTCGACGARCGRRGARRALARQVIGGSSHRRSIVWSPSSRRAPCAPECTRLRPAADATVAAAATSAIAAISAGRTEIIVGGKSASSTLGGAIELAARDDVTCELDFQYQLFAGERRNSPVCWVYV